jgi:hypothetical protein
MTQLPELDLEGRSLTVREYSDACFAWLDRRHRDETLDEAIAHAEARRMIERFAAGEPWDVIRAESRGVRQLEL